MGMSNCLISGPLVRSTELNRQSSPIIRLPQEIHVIPRQRCTRYFMMMIQHLLGRETFLGSGQRFLNCFLESFLGFKSLTRASPSTWRGPWEPFKKGTGDECICNSSRAWMRVTRCRRFQPTRTIHLTAFADLWTIFTNQFPLWIIRKDFAISTQYF